MDILPLGTPLESTRGASIDRLIARAYARGLTPHSEVLDLLQRYKREELSWTDLYARLQARTAALYKQIEALYVKRMFREEAVG